MKKKINKLFAAIGIAIVVCLMGGILLYDGKNRVSKTETDELPVNETETSESSIKETSAGFYLYDEEKNPIMNSQNLDIGVNGQMELNIECVNVCEVDLNYTLVILVNDCYQDVSYEEESGLFQGRGKIQKEASEMINAKFEISSYDRGKKNELRILMFYYPEEVPENELEQVLVGASIGIYPVTGTIANKTSPENDLQYAKSYDLNAKDATQAIWLTENKCKTIPEFDFILDIQNQKSIYFHSVGGNKRYLGMVFIDGEPVSINGNYVFGWKQKKGHLLSCKLIDELADGETAFAYMYKQGAGWEQTYITNLYKLNYQGE